MNRQKLEEGRKESLCSINGIAIYNHKQNLSFAILLYAKEIFSKFSNTTKETEADCLKKNGNHLSYVQSNETDL